MRGDPVVPEGHTEASHEGKSAPAPRAWRGGGAGGGSSAPAGPTPHAQGSLQAPEEMALPIRAITYTEHCCGFCFKGVSSMPFSDSPENGMKTALQRSARGTGNVRTQCPGPIIRLLSQCRRWACL